jgi:nucleoid DNA-binding protein
METNENQKPARKKKERVPTRTRKDIERKLEEKLLGKKISKKLIVDTLIESMRELITETKPFVRLEIRDFGIFEVKSTKPKPKARNLMTGEFVYVPGRRKILFRPGRLIKNFLKEPYENNKSE